MKGYRLLLELLAADKLQAIQICIYYCIFRAADIIGEGSVATICHCYMTSSNDKLKILK